MTKRVGIYLRVSTSEQITDNQRRARSRRRAPQMARGERI
jgi:hypothetical protein